MIVMLLAIKGVCRDARDRLNCLKPRRRHRLGSADDRDQGDCRKDPSMIWSPHLLDL